MLYLAMLTVGGVRSEPMLHGDRRVGERRDGVDRRCLDRRASRRSRETPATFSGREARDVKLMALGGAARHLPEMQE